MCHKKLYQKILIILLIGALTISDWFVLGSTMAHYAMDKSTDKKGAIDFQFAFMSQDGNQNLGQTLQADVAKNYQLQIQIKNQENGYLKDAYLQWGKKNFAVDFASTKEKQIEKVEDQTIQLNTINSGESIQLLGSVKANFKDTVKLEDMKVKDALSLYGTYVKSDGKEVKIKQEIPYQVEWMGNYTLQTEESIKQAILFEQDHQKKLLVRTSLKVQLDAEQKLPVKDLKISMVPLTIEGKQPSYVHIQYQQADLLGLPQIDSDHWSQKTEDQLIQIEAKQDDSALRIGRGSDIFEITYVFDGDNIKEGQSIVYSKQIQAMATLCASQESTLTSQDNRTIEQTVQKGDIVSFQMGGTAEMNKAKMYVNASQPENPYTISYQSTWEADVWYAEAVHEIRMHDLETQYQNDKNAEIAKGNTVYQKTKIAKESFQKILGENGLVSILNEKQEEIARIDKNSPVDDQQNYFVTFASPVSHITIQTSQPMTEGKLIFEQEKSFTQPFAFSKQQIQQFQSLMETVVGQVQDIPIEKQASQKINLVESQSAVAFNSSNTNLSTITKNENVDLKIELKNNQPTSDMYQNPKFALVFPSAVTAVNVKNVNVLFDSTFQIQEISQTTWQGHIVILITLKGSQADFLPDQMMQGTTILCQTDIEVDVKTPNQKTPIELYYQNENANSYEKTGWWQGQNWGYTTLDCQFIAPDGMISAMEITGFQGQDKVASYAQGEKTGKLEILTNEKIATMHLTVLNHTDAVAKNIVAVGNIPFANNQQVITGEKLGTNQTTQMTSLVQYKGNPEDVTIYYSDQDQVTYDLTDQASGWTTNPSQAQKVKQFMIVVQRELPATEILEFSYTFKIPAMLEHNCDLYGSFGCAFDRVTEQGTSRDTSVADKVGLSTGRGPQMKILQSVSVGDGNPVGENQKIKYKIKVENIGLDPIENMKITDQIPKGTSYVQYDTANWQTAYEVHEPKANEIYWKIDRLEVGKSVDLEFEVAVQDLPTVEEYYAGDVAFTEKNGKFYYQGKEVTQIPETSIQNVVQVEAKDLEKTMQSTSSPNKVVPASLQIEETASSSKGSLLKENQKMKYSIHIASHTEDTLQNVQIQKKLPEGLKYLDAYTLKYNADLDIWEKDLQASYDETTRMVQLNIPTLASHDDIQLKVETQTEPLADDEDQKEIETDTTVQADGTAIYHSETQENAILKSKVNVRYTCVHPKKYLQDGETVEYQIQVSNPTPLDLNQVKIVDPLPKGLKFVKAVYQMADGTQVETNESAEGVVVQSNLLAGQTISLWIQAEAQADTEETTIQNRIKIDGDQLEPIEKMANTQVVEKKASSITEQIQEENHQNNYAVAEGQTEHFYSLAGTVWQDANQDGIQEDTEARQSQVTVMALDVHTNQVMTQTQTGSDGKYRLEGLKPGQYYVIFQYDNQKYMPTSYRKTADESRNSKAILANIQLDGKLQQGAVSDLIDLTQVDQENINLGIMEKPTFDLALDTSIEKMTVKTSKEVKEYAYDHANLAKVDIAPQELNSAMVWITYKVRVTNEGNSVGYAQSIVDYKPQNLQFYAEVNPDWYVGTDGNLYTHALENEAIQPGETKEITLLLVKQMTETNTGISLNTAEIEKDYNDFGLEDRDSTPGNKAESEDDLGSCTALITVQTGGKILYFTIVILVVLIMGLGGVAINRTRILANLKREHKKKIYK